jgi:hypothetical protein
LPTSEEWEYACRAGTQTTYYHGDAAASLQDYAWIDLNSVKRPQPVGGKLPNDFGVFDMLGNVWEWCAPLSDGAYAYRGGGVGSSAALSRCAAIRVGAAETASGAVGFRVVCELPASALATASGDGSDFALAFDGKSHHVRIPAIQRGARESLTIEAWTIPAKAYPNAENCLLIMADYDQPRLQVTREPSLVWQGTYYALAASGRTEPVVVRSSVPPGTERQHVAYVIDRADEKVASRLYVNGQLAGELPLATETTSTTKIGEWAFLGGMKDRHYAGVLDEVRISKIARYQAAFDPPARFSPDEHTLALYHCDEGSGDTLADASPNQNHGQIVGATWVAGLTGPPRLILTPASPPPLPMFRR